MKIINPTKKCLIKIVLTIEKNFKLLNHNSKNKLNRPWKNDLPTESILKQCKNITFTIKKKYEKLFIYFDPQKLLRML